MTLAAYTGHEALTFPDYLDQETGRTLTAEPGETYDIAPASGRAIPDVPEGWFTPIRFATGGPVKSKGAPAEGDGTPGLKEETGGEPGEDEDSAF